MSEDAKRYLESLKGVWEERRAGRPLPTRADLSVSILRPWLGNLALFECQPQRGAIFRLCGTSLHERFGGEFNGKPVSAIEPKLADHLEHHLAATITSQMPQWATHLARKHNSIMAFQEIFLPLACTEGGADIVLFASYQEAR
jgi:hypothetical protein